MLSLKSVVCLQDVQFLNFATPLKLLSNVKLVEFGLPIACWGGRKKKEGKEEEKGGERRRKGSERAGKTI